MESHFVVPFFYAIFAKYKGLDMITLTKRLMRKWFREFNKEFFDNEIKMPKMLITNTRDYLGQSTVHPDKKMSYFKYEIKLSIYHKRSYMEYRASFLHEMIHIWTHQKEGRWSHAGLFHDKATEINKKTNNLYNISTYTFTESPLRNGVESNRAVTLVLINAQMPPTAVDGWGTNWLYCICHHKKDALKLTKVLRGDIPGGTDIHIYQAYGAFSSFDEEDFCGLRGNSKIYHYVLKYLDSKEQFYENFGDRLIEDTHTVVKVA